MRLTGGGILCLVIWLWPVSHGLSLTGNAYRDYAHVLFYGVLAASTFAFVAPTFWRGEKWQGIFAFALLWLPGIVLFRAIQLIIGLL